MQKYNENGENFNNLTIIEKEITEDIRSIEIMYNNNCIYDFIGEYKMVMLDTYTLGILSNDEEKYITYITTTKEGPIISSFKVPDDMFFVTLSRIKKAIVPYGFRNVVYSYEFGIITSASYESITYRDGYFDVAYNINLDDTLVKLEGTLDMEGHLIDEALYAKELDTYILVDEHNLDESIMMELPRLERKLS